MRPLGDKVAEVMDQLMPGCEVLTVSMRGYLNAMRRGGSINMFGAAPYLAETYNLEKSRARKALGEWMRTFKEDE